MTELKSIMKPNKAISAKNDRKSNNIMIIDKKIINFEAKQSSGNVTMNQSIAEVAESYHELLPSTSNASTEQKFKINIQKNSQINHQMGRSNIRDFSQS